MVNLKILRDIYTEQANSTHIGEGSEELMAIN